MRDRKGDAKRSVRITTIEGRRSVTRGSASMAEYAEKRKSLVSRENKIGKSKYA